jgi:hypothetical protein
VVLALIVNGWKLNKAGDLQGGQIFTQTDDVVYLQWRLLRGAFVNESRYSGRGAVFLRDPFGRRSLCASRKAAIFV